MRNFDIINGEHTSKTIEIGIIPNIKTQFESIQKERSDGYPKVTEIKSKKKFISDVKDLNYDKPWINLFKNYAI